MKESMTCPVCGEIIPVESINCPECGWDEDFAEWHEEFNEEKDSNSIEVFQRTKKENTTDWIWWFKIITSVTVVVFTFLFVSPFAAFLLLVVISVYYSSLRFTENFTNKGKESESAVLYEELVELSGRDYELVKRLIDYERQRDPDSNEIDWIKSAIFRLERDRG